MLSTQHVFIIGSKGIPANYGGYETFVDKLTEYYEERSDIMFHVACKNGKKAHYFHHNADCFRIRVPKKGKAQAVLYDTKAMAFCYKYIKSRRIENAIVYILACRMGPWMHYYHRKLNQLGAKVYVNPDGHEWKRKKWNFFIRRYWKISERMMIKNCDLVVCDNGNIEKYIQEEYGRYQPKTTFIAYGAEIVKSLDKDTKKSYHKWLKKRNLVEKEYYLIVGRFVPENNFETVIREVMKSNTQKKLVIISTVNDKLYEQMRKKLHFENDDRIQFVGSVYKQKLLSAIRKGAFAYIHGHEVGGTNPSLLESLGSASLSLVYKVNFNEEVCKDAVLYWTKEEGNLASQIEHAEGLSEAALAVYAARSRERITDDYSWVGIAKAYEHLFLEQ